MNAAMIGSTPSAGQGWDAEDEETKARGLGDEDVEGLDAVDPRALPRKTK
jgi:hypothetical protein